MVLNLFKEMFQRVYPEQKDIFKNSINIITTMEGERNEATFIMAIATLARLDGIL